MKTKKPAFVVQKHEASHLHFDFRLEKDGVLKSWAIPKEPPREYGVKRLAIPTDDHPLDYGSFEGEITEGSYGAGNVEIWDKGYYVPIKYRSNEIIVELHGKKLQGVYCFIPFKPKKGKGQSWLFFRKKR